MKINALLSLLENYNSKFSSENLFKKEIIYFLQPNPDCFERSLEIGHITASAWLLNKDNTYALLMHHAKLQDWFQLGGHCDGDSDVLSISIKEAQEIGN